MHFETAGDHTAFELFDEWSKRDPERYDEDACKDNWSGYDLDCAHPVRFGSIVAWAREVDPSFLGEPVATFMGPVPKLVRPKKGLQSKPHKAEGDDSTAGYASPESLAKFHEVHPLIWAQQVREWSDDRREHPTVTAIESNSNRNGT